MKAKPQKVRKIKCPYCDVMMKYRGAQRIQLGRWGLLMEHWDNWLSGALSVQLYECPECGKIEMFRLK